MFKNLILILLVQTLVECKPRLKRQVCDQSLDLTQVPADCSKFYRCANGVLTVYQCSPGLLFDNNLRVCNWATQVSSCNSNVAKNSCGYSDDFSNVPDDCSKFYRCVNGALVVQSCPPGLEFDAINKICNWPNQARCVSKSTCDPALDLTQVPNDCTRFYRCINRVLSTLSCPSGYLFDRLAKACNPSNQVTTCNTASCNSVIDLTPVSGNCSQFYRCVNGLQSILTCPSGYLFDRNAKTCNPANQVVCSSCDPALDLTPYPNDCSKFYKCINGALSTLTCPSGYLFDKNAKACNPSNQVTCSTCDPSTDLTQVPNDCTKFYRCINGVQTTLTCPSGYLFDKNAKACNPANQVTTCYSCGSQHLTNVPGDCTRYYMCINNVLSTFNCPAGTTFDNVAKNCRVTSQITGKCGPVAFPNCPISLSDASRLDLCSQSGFRTDYPSCC